MGFWLSEQLERRRQKPCEISSRSHSALRERVVNSVLAMTNPSVAEMGGVGAPPKGGMAWSDPPLVLEDTRKQEFFHGSGIKGEGQSLGDASPLPRKSDGRGALLLLVWRPRGPGNWGTVLLRGAPCPRKHLSRNKSRMSSHTRKCCREQNGIRLKIN